MSHIYFRFGRILPLPSEGWQEMCANVFCHGNGILPAGDALSPKVDDCFTSNSDYMLHSGVMKDEMLEVGQHMPQLSHHCIVIFLIPLICPH